MRKQYFERARASLCEVVGAIDLARDLGAMTAARWRESQELAGHVAAIIVGLLRACG